MKTIKNIAVILIFGMLGACVSTKKYNKALEEARINSEKYQDDMKRLEASASEQIKKEKQQLAAKEKELDEREKKMAELNSLIDAQRNAVMLLKQEVCAALKCFSPDELSVEIRDGKLYVSMSDKLLFPSGSDKVNSRGKEAISMLAAVLSNSDLEIMVEGHTDNVPISSGRNPDNWDLSVHRATNVTRILINDGIKPQRIISSGRAEYHPIASNINNEGRQQNRRTEIVLAPKLDKLWKLTEDKQYTANTTEVK